MGLAEPLPTQECWLRFAKEVFTRSHYLSLEETCEVKAVWGKDLLSRICDFKAPAALAAQYLEAVQEQLGGASFKNVIGS